MKRPNQTPNPVWSDGIHFVRPASEMDEHPLRWVVGAHKATASKYTRHSRTRDEGSDAAAVATKRWLKDNPADRVYMKVSAPPEASSKVIPAPFAITHFDCIVANPYAQVWQCTSYPNTDRAPVGRRRADGKPPKQTTFRHRLGECAVMIGAEPVRDPDGQVTVFPTWSHADEHALNLYYGADEEDVISWVEGHPRVYATGQLEVLFDPNVRGRKKPFILWHPVYRKPVFVDTTRPIIYGKQRDKNKAAIDNPQAQADRLLRESSNGEDRVAALEDRALQFRSIWEAIDEAYRREKMIQGKVVL